MTTLVKPEPPKVGVKVPTLGPYVCSWIEKNLVHSEGDYLGQTFKLRRWQKKFIWKAYELNPDGTRKYVRALLGLPKGNGKTELAAALGCAELAGPVVCEGWREDGRPIYGRRTSPIIPVAAASFEQADLLFGAAATMIREGPLSEFFDCWDTEIVPKPGHGSGRMYRVAAVAGTNDGGKPTFFLGDELHEWTGKKERVHLVLSNNRAKRANTWELAITTAGWDPDSLLGRLYAHGKKVAAGEVEDPEFLFEWHEPSDPKCDIADNEALEKAIRESNPAADDFLPIGGLKAKAVEIAEHEFRRYHLNQWTSSPERWLPQGTWEARFVEREPPEDGAFIAVGFDGSYSGDSTAVVGATVEQVPHLFVVDAWEKDANKKDEEDPGWRVDILDVEQCVRDSCGKWQVWGVGCDPYRWQRTLAVLLEEGFPILEWASHLPSRMVPACAQFYDAVNPEIKTEFLTHDGDERLTRHIHNSVVKIDARGPRITKEYRNSTNRIDLAVAAIIAYDLALKALNDGGWGLL